MKKDESFVELGSSSDDEEEQLLVEEEEVVQEEEPQRMVKQPLLPLPEKNRKMEIPSGLAAAVASTWQKVLRLMEKDGLYDGEIPESFMVEGLTDGGLILRVVHMPKNIISVPKDSVSALDRSFYAEDLERDERRERIRVRMEEEDEYEDEEEEEPSTGRRSLEFQEDGYVSVGEK